MSMIRGCVSNGDELILKSELPTEVIQFLGDHPYIELKIYSYEELSTMANKTEPTGSDLSHAIELLKLLRSQDALTAPRTLALALAEARDQYRLSVMLEYTKREALAFEAGHQAALRSRPALGELHGCKTGDCPHEKQDDCEFDLWLDQYWELSTKEISIAKSAWKRSKELRPAPVCGGPSDEEIRDQAIESEKNSGPRDKKKIGKFIAGAKWFRSLLRPMRLPEKKNVKVVASDHEYHFHVGYNAAIVDFRRLNGIE